MQAAEGSRERKKKLDSRGESLRFEKSLALAQKQLKEPSRDRPLNGLNSVQDEKITNSTDKKVEISKTGLETNDIQCKPPKTADQDVLGINEESFLANCKDEENYISALRLSMMDTSPASQPNGSSPQQVNRISRQRPMSPTSTSTPKGQVMFSSAVTEINLSSASTPGQDSRKKIPPPPPPRHSSRSSMKSPSPTATKSDVTLIADRAQSPPMYENLDELNILLKEKKKGKDTAKLKDPAKVKDLTMVKDTFMVNDTAKVKDSVLNSSPKARSQRPKSTSDVGFSDKSEKERPKSQYSPTKTHGSPTKTIPMPAKTQHSPTRAQYSPTKVQYSPTKMRQLNKFQQELAAGIYSNLNRPDLQTQKINPARVVHDATSPDDTSSNSSSSTSLDSQLGGTIKRNKNVKLGAKSDNIDVEKKKSPTGKARKIPPPPPQRKTSSLSQSLTETDLKSECASVVKSEKSPVEAGTKSPPSRLQAQYEQMKQRQKEHVERQFENGSVSQNGATATIVSAKQDDKANAHYVEQKIHTSVVSQLVLTQAATSRANTCTVTMATTKSHDNNIPIVKSHGDNPPATLPKTSNVANGDVNKITTGRVAKCDTAMSRTFEETEIY